MTTERQRAYFARIGLKDKVQAEFEMTYKELRELALKDDISAGKMAAAITDQAGFIFGGARL